MEHNKEIPFPFLSVIVPTYNRKDKIGDCLDSLINQDYPNFETIVVDDGSTDDTSKIVSNYPVKLIKNEKNLGLWEARNIGIENSKGEIIAFLDDDALAERDWLKKLVECMNSPEIAVVTGPIFPLFVILNTGFPPILSILLTT